MSERKCVAKTNPSSEHCMCGWEVGVFVCCKCSVLEAQVFEEPRKYYNTCKGV